MGYDISASGSSSSATGAQKISGNSGFVIGGSVGLSWTWVAVAAGAVAFWFLFLRKK